MPVGKHLPLGQAIPDSLHAVSVSIPTMADVIGYEEKDEATLAKLRSGYPRFVLHRYLREIAAYWANTLFACPQHTIWPTSSEAMAKRLQAHLAPTPSTLLKHGGVSALRILTDSQTNTDAKLFLQHIGGFLSTRQAEDYLATQGLLKRKTEEARYPDSEDAAAHIRSSLAPLYDVPADDVILCNTGMNAFYAAFQAVRARQAATGRHAWIKIGWLYTDTMHILDKLSGEEANNIELLDVFDLEGLETALRERGDSIAGIVTEAPTNPLIQTMDLHRIHDLATQHDVLLIVDPTVASPYNVDVAPCSHIIVNSLTKYAACEGDVMLGAIALTDSCPDRAALDTLIRQEIEPAYPADCARLAYQIDHYKDFSDQINATAAAVIAFLESHPKVGPVFWSREGRSRKNFDRIARSPASIGGLLSFEYEGELATFYDAVPLPKGPSFGMRSTLISPYVYLAHYSLATTDAGRDTLARAGIKPELLRLSIGEEPASEIIAALKIGLETSST